MAVGGEITIKSGTTPGTPSAGNITLWADADGTLQALQSSGSSSGLGMYSAYMKCSDVKSQNTGGGTFTQDAWQTRVINTEDADTGGNMSISSNQITLDAGTYRILAVLPANSVNFNQARVYNISDSDILLTGRSSYARGDPSYQNVPATIQGRFTISAQKVLEIQHYCQTTATSGFGSAANFTTEIYATIELWKEA